MEITVGVGAEATGTLIAVEIAAGVTTDGEEVTGITISLPS